MHWYLHHIFRIVFLSSYQAFLTTWRSPWADALSGTQSLYTQHPARHAIYHDKLMPQCCVFCFSLCLISCLLKYSWFVNRFLPQTTYFGLANVDDQACAQPLCGRSLTDRNYHRNYGRSLDSYTANTAQTLLNIFREALYFHLNLRRVEEKIFKNSQSRTPGSSINLHSKHKGTPTPHSLDTRAGNGKLAWGQITFFYFTCHQ